MSVNPIVTGSLAQAAGQTNAKERTKPAGTPEAQAKAPNEDSYTLSPKGKEYQDKMMELQAQQLMSLASEEEEDVQKILYDHPDLATETPEKRTVAVPVEDPAEEGNGEVSLGDLLDEALDDAVEDAVDGVESQDVVVGGTDDTEETPEEGDGDEDVQEEEETRPESIHGRVSSLSPQDLALMQMAAQTNAMYSVEYSNTLFDHMTSGNQGALQELLDYSASYTSWIANAFTSGEDITPDEEYTSDELAQLLEDLKEAAGLGSSNSTEDTEGTEGTEGEESEDSSEESGAEAVTKTED